MREQEFSSLVESGLLREVETVVVAAHRGAALKHGKSWREPDAYRWLRYENADPVGRLDEGVQKLRRRGAEFDAEAVDKACARASKAGFLN